MSQDKKTYYKNEDGFVLNVFHKDGEPVELFEKQAKYMLAPLGTELRLEKTVPAAAPAPTKAAAGSAKPAAKQTV